jgi:glycosyltransferase involved in cell wall biosynthesis
MKISIITVVFNNVDTVAAAVESVIHQDYENIEYIIIDGGSDDGTLAALEDYKEHFATFISEPDEGIYDAMNKGIKEANGEIIGILNSDDLYHTNNVISKVVKAFRKNSIDVVFGDLHYVKKNNLDKVVRYYSSAKFHPSKFRFGFMPAHPTFFTKKEHYENLGLYKTNYEIAADFELLLRFLKVYNLEYKYLPINMIKMRMGGRSTSSLKSNYILNKEMVRACKENDMYTNIGIISLKYFVKVFELFKRG